MTPTALTITKLRVGIDYEMKCVDTNRDSAETTRAFRSLQMGKGWLGQALHYIGTPTPYKVVEQVSDIPPTADEVPNCIQFMEASTPDEYLGYWNDMRNRLNGLIAKIETQVEANLKEECMVALDDIKEDFSNADNIANQHSKIRWAITNSIQHLIEAKMWLGFEIANLRKKQ